MGSLISCNKKQSTSSQDLLLPPRPWEEITHQHFPNWWLSSRLCPHPQRLLSSLMEANQFLQVCCKYP